MSTNPITTTEVDFFELKDSLRAFLESKPDFTDYNFDGSALNILTDVLAYAAHIQAAHANLTISESFLDSSQQRSSVVSHAKQLGYVPRSTTAPYAVLSLSFSVSGNPSQYVIPKNTKFTTTVDGSSYYFVTVEDTIIENNGSNLFVGNITVYQGKFTDYNYLVSTNENQRFLIPSTKVDTRFLTVSVAPSSSGTYTEYSYFDTLDIGSLSEDSEVYFLQESYDGFFQVYFGDSVIGKSVVAGNIVKLTYLLTDGPASNFARSFSLASTLSGVTGVSVSLVEAAQNGADRESVSSIKYLAPFYYQAQNRAVTENDYVAIVKSNYADIDDVAVWGGEKNNPPFYGKVFLAVKPKNSTYFSNFVKQSIQNNIISRFNVVTIRPEIVDPDYIDVSVSTVLTYNSKLYKPTSTINLSQLVKDSISSFFLSETNKFGNPLYFSKLVSNIDSTSDLILSSITNLTLEKSVEVYTGSSATYTLEFNNYLKPGSISSNDLRIGSFVWKLKDIQNDDQITGTLYAYRTSGSIETKFSVGTINYNTGLVSITNFKIDSVEDADDLGRLYISVSQGSFIDTDNPTVVFTDFNVYTNKRNQIIRLNPRTDVSVALLPS